MADKKYNQQGQPYTMKLCNDINMMSSITHLTHSIDYTAVNIVIREKNDILKTISWFLDVIKLFPKKPVFKQWKSVYKIVIDWNLILNKENICIK